MGNKLRKLKMDVLGDGGEENKENVDENATEKNQADDQEVGLYKSFSVEKRDLLEIFSTALKYKRCVALFRFPGLRRMHVTKCSSAW